MKRALACTCLLAALALLTGAGPALCGEYTPCGKGSATEKFMSQDGDRAASIGRPAVLYVYYGGKGSNADAKFLEGDEFLANTDVQKQLKNFQCLRMDISRSDKMPKNWPLAIVDRAKSYKNCLAVLNSDFSSIVYFKKVPSDAGVLEANPKNLLAAMENTLKYETKKKELADKEAKAKPKDEPPADQKAKPLVPGLGDDDKKDPKAKDKDKDKDKDKEKKKPNTPVEE
jgi:hypothetical protein